jgi:hypothetical protein
MITDDIISKNATVCTDYLKTERDFCKLMSKRWSGFYNENTKENSVIPITLSYFFVGLSIQ